MIIVMKPNAPEEAVRRVTDLIQKKGLDTHLSQGKEVTIIGVVGDKNKLSNENLMILPWVEKLVPITESYKLSNRKFHPEPSSVRVKNHEIGPGTLTIMAGPCAVETEEQLMAIAREVKKGGAQFVRGGAYKPRTSPYSFQGLEEEGLRYMAEAGKEYDLCTICEVISEEAIEAAGKIRGYDTDRSAQHAEFSASAGGGTLRDASAFKARPGRHHRRMAERSGIYHRGGQSERRSLRARNPNL